MNANAAGSGNPSSEDLMRFLDGEATPEERKAVQRGLDDSSEMRRELAVFKAMKAQLQGLSFAPPAPGASAWDQIRVRITQPLGWVLTASGTLAWIAYGVWVFATSSTAIVAKLATGAVAIGILVLLGGVVLARVQAYKTDPYKNVHR